MATTIDRTNYNLLVDDTGGVTPDGTNWNKNQIKIVILDQIDAILAASVTLGANLTTVGSITSGAGISGTATSVTTIACTTITASGLITTNGQVKFPATQNPSADANTLDDYEEGTWTPTFTGATVVGVATYDGRYIKIGRMVFFSLNITSTTSFASSSRTSTYFSLPFTISGTYPGILHAVNFGTNAEYGQNVIAIDGKAYMPQISAVSNISVTGQFEASA